MASGYPVQRDRGIIFFKVQPDHISDAFGFGKIPNVVESEIEVLGPIAEQTLAVST